MPIDMPHEVEERYLRLLRRQEGKAAELARRSKPPKRSTHKSLTISSGDFKGLYLKSPTDSKVRPMMAKVRGAVFSMILARIGLSRFPSESTWLDLFAGTGSVGIEALSRGCRSCDFVELDDWTSSEVLRSNVDELDLHDRCSIHTESVHTYLKRHSRVAEFGEASAFDFVSVCPPYNVSFESLMEELARSKVLSETTFMFVEYPSEQSEGIHPSCGPLTCIKKKKFGRTILALFGPPS